MSEWLLATANTDLNVYVKEIAGQNRKKIEIAEVKDIEQLFRIVAHQQLDVLLLTEAFLSSADEDLISYFNRIRFLSNVRIIFITPGRKSGDRVLDYIIRECGIYDLFLDSEIDGKRLHSVLFKPSEKCSVAHLIMPVRKEESLETKDEVCQLGAERQKNILRNILNGISQKDFRDIFEDMPSSIKSQLIKQEVVEKEIIREVPKVVIKNSVKVIERLKIQKQQILAFWSPKDHQGRSHVLTQLAILLSQQSEARILVIDLDTENPSLDMYFGIKELNVIDSYEYDGSSPLRILIDAVERNNCSIDVLQGNTIPVRHGLDIIFNNPYSCESKKIELKGLHIKSLIDTAAELYDYVFLDLPCSLEDDAAVAAIKRSSSIIVISEGELTAVRSLHTRFLSNRALFPKDKCKIIINKAIPGVLEESEIQDYLGQDFDISYIPWSERCIASVLQQKPFIYSCSRKEQKPYNNILEKIVIKEKIAISRKG